MSKVVRSVKNVTKGYSHVQVKVRNATSNDPWGPTGTEMSEIAQLTFNNSTDFYEIMDMLDKRLNDKGKNWRHVLKSLKVLDYCLHEGSELVVTWARKNIYIIKTLREFQYVDEDGRDVGQNVRVSAKELTSLILDEDRLRSERLDRKTWKSRVTGIEEYGGRAGGSAGGYGSDSGSAPRRKPDRRRNDDDDAEYRLAIEASKHEAEEEARRRKNKPGDDVDDDLAKAIKLSKEEEELRKRELEESNAASLFDDTPVQNTQQPQFTGYNQGYQQQAAVDWFGNPVDQNQQLQQPQTTGFLNQAYSQPTGLQVQPTGYQNGYSNGFQPQASGFGQGQFGTQSPTYLQPQQTVQPQQTAFGGGFNNPYGQQQNEFNAQNQAQNFAQAGSNNPWASNQQQTEALRPTPTGSNNPFASSFGRPQPAQTGPPSLSTLQEQKTAQFQPTYNQQPSFSPQPTPQKDQNPAHAHLNALLASGEGQDTFGNVGNLRIPAQHTAPGTFVNSAGQGLNRLNANQTGNNPFLQSQFTGVPQQRFAPAQTGPAGSFGNAFGAQPSNNPFGQQNGHQQQQTGSLIDL